LESQNSILVEADETAVRQSETYRRLCCLPRFHPNAVRLLGVSTESDSALEDFESVFRSDPALSADLLTAANSPEFGLRARIASIRNALSFLGLNRIRSLAISIAMSQYVRTKVNSAGLQPVWAHGVATAVIAEQLGRRSPGPQPHLYTAGLVHDVGRLGLMLSGADYGGLISKEFRSMDEAAKLEQLLFGVTHAQAGAFLAKSWNFPPLLCDCIEKHHEIGGLLDDELIRITQAACILATELGYPELQGPSLEGAERDLASEFLRRSGVTLEQLKEQVEARSRGNR